MRKRRHPFRSLVFGLILGLGPGLMSIIYGIDSLGVITPWAAVVLGVVIGLIVVFIPSRKAMRARTG
jgi:hypothetical protein